MKINDKILRNAASQIGVLCAAGGVVDGSIGSGELLAAGALSIAGVVLVFLSSFEKTMRGKT